MELTAPPWRPDHWRPESSLQVPYHGITPSVGTSKALDGSPPAARSTISGNPYADENRETGTPLGLEFRQRLLALRREREISAKKLERLESAVEGFAEAACYVPTRRWSIYEK